MKGKVLFFSVVFYAVIGTWLWGEYQQRPRVLDGLGHVILGMTPAQVVGVLGRPTEEFAQSEVEDQRLEYNYRKDGLSDYLVVFWPDEAGEQKADIICREGGSVFGLAVGQSSELDIIEKLGKPSHRSFGPDGRAKAISYENFKVAFEVEGGWTREICVSQSGSISYTLESIRV
ncbi:MAG: hypothetical protein GWM88_08980 [Pseudomonadales bacterium]|nr:hypothetical protein [Pseudomonadales bacterium]NIX08134.1 hypothetical protein [Pseudomonadales bacterium]